MADSRIALLFLRPGQVATIMSAIESVTVHLSHGSGMAWGTLGAAAIPGGAGPVTHPGGQGMIPGPVGGRIPAPGIMQPVGHITAVFRAQPHPVAHILDPMGLAPAAAAAGAPAPGGSNGGCEAQDGFVKQRVDVSIVVVTVVLVT